MAKNKSISKCQGTLAHAHLIRTGERLRQEASTRDQHVARRLLQERERATDLAERVQILEEELAEARLDSERRALAQLG